MANFVSAGDMVDYTPSADVDAGDVIVQGDLVGVATSAIDSGTLGAIAVSGVFDFPKDTSTAIDAGDTVYWNSDDEEAQEDSVSDAYALLGRVVIDAAEADATVRVRLIQ